MTDRPLDPAFAASFRNGMTRRRLLGVAGLAGVAALATACGTGADDTGGAAATGSAAASGSGAASAGPSVATQPDKSSTEKVVNWSTWPLYIDVDDKTGKRPTLEAFQKQTGIAVTYTEDVNDNNEFYAKVRTQLEQGQDIGRDLVVLTDWMAAIWIQNGYAQKLDKANIPNSKNLLPKLQNVAFDPNRDYTLPWQSGFGGLGFNKAALKQAMGVDKITTVQQLFDPKLKGRVTVLSEMRDAMGVIMGSQGTDPSKFTDDQFQKGIDELTKQVDNGQIRQVTGNDYIAALENGDVIAVIGWSGDIFALGPKYGFELPETGGTLWTDNMLIPAMAAHKANAEKVMNYYYEPKVAAEVAAYVQYITPVQGAQEAMKAIDPKLVNNEYIFPTSAMLDRSFVFMQLTEQQQTDYERAFQKAIGN